MTCGKCSKSRICGVKADFDEVVRTRLLQFTTWDLGTMQSRFHAFIGSCCQEFEDETKEATSPD